MQYEGKSRIPVPRVGMRRKCDEQRTVDVGTLRSILEMYCVCSNMAQINSTSYCEMARTALAAKQLLLQDSATQQKAILSILDELYWKNKGSILHLTGDSSKRCKFLNLYTFDFISFSYWIIFELFTISIQNQLLIQRYTTSLAPHQQFRRRD